MRAIAVLVTTTLETHFSTVGCSNDAAHVLDGKFRDLQVAWVACKGDEHECDRCAD